MFDPALLQHVGARVVVGGASISPSATARRRLVRWLQERWRLRSVAENASPQSASCMGRDHSTGCVRGCHRGDGGAGSESCEVESSGTIVT